MKVFSRVSCITASLVPAIAVWLSLKQRDRFLDAFMDLGSFDRSFSWHTGLVIDTLDSWPLLIMIGWVILIPAMFDKPWAKRMRSILVVVFLVVGTFIYAFCVDALYRPTITYAKLSLESLVSEIDSSPRMTRDEVHEIADRFAEIARDVDGDPFELKNYPDRRAEFDVTQGVWRVIYWRKPQRQPGADHFIIKIYDATAQGRYIGGR